MKPLLTAIFPLLALLTGGCVAPPRPDYTLFRERLPRSIIILPPLNETADVEASRLAMSTLTFAPAERGYYIFPITLVDTILRNEGAPSPHEMRQLSYRKLRELFGADALLDITIQHWGTQYLFLTSSTQVSFSYRLIDLASGATLWSGMGSAQSSPQGQNGLVETAIAAAVHATIAATTNREVELSREAHFAALTNPDYGLLPGPRALLDQQK